ncbi:NAD-dependent epimerase/dehydratase family protein [Enterobacter sp. BRE11]|nr:NAD-dependent epimerase/dehydratase family protein [Enterobacter sp. BRE11]
MQKILVIGGSGFIGANLIEYLCKLNYSVINYGRSPSPFVHENVLNIKGSIKDIDSLNAIFKEHDINVVVHSMTTFTPLEKINSCQDHLALNLSAIIDLIGVMKENNVKRLVYMSSGGSVYGKSSTPLTEKDSTAPESFYGWMKESVENYLKFYSRIDPEFSHIIIRPANVYGKYQKLDKIIGVALKHAHLGQTLKIFGSTKICKDYIHVSDLCEITTKLMASDAWNAIYNAGTCVGTTLQDIIISAEKVTGKPLIIELHEHKVGDVVYSVLDNSKVNSKINKVSYKNILEGMAEMYDHVIQVLNHKA